MSYQFTSFYAGEPPVDPSVGFLPPNNGTDGQGYVTFTIRPKQQVSSLSRIDARATIIFDQNEPIDTPPIFNTVHIHAYTRNLISKPVPIRPGNDANVREERRVGFAHD